MARAITSRNSGLDTPRESRRSLRPQPRDRDGHARRATG